MLIAPLAVAASNLLGVVVNFARAVALD